MRVVRKLRPDTLFRRNYYLRIILTVHYVSSDPNSLVFITFSPGKDK